MAPINKLSDWRSTDLGWPLLKDICNNQPNDGVGGGGGVGEAMQTGGTRGGGPSLVVLSDEWSDEKNKIERRMGPWILMAFAGWEHTTTNRMSAVLLAYIW